MQKLPGNLHKIGELFVPETKTSEDNHRTNSESREACPGFWNWKMKGRYITLKGSRRAGRRGMSTAELICSCQPTSRAAEAQDL